MLLRVHTHTHTHTHTHMHNSGYQMQLDVKVLVILMVLDYQFLILPGAMFLVELLISYICTMSCGERERQEQTD